MATPVSHEDVYCYRTSRSVLQRVLDGESVPLALIRRVAMRVIAGGLA